MMDLDRELWRLGIPAKTRHNEVAPGPVRDGAGLRGDLGRLGPQHGGHEPDAPARRAARPDVPHPREAVRRHQRLGQAQQLVDGDRRRREPARPGQRPARQRPVPGLPAWRSSAASTSTPTCSGRASPTPATTIASAPTRRRRRSCRSSSAPSSWTSSTSSSRVPAAASKKGGELDARGHLAAGPRRATRPTATGPRRSPSPATSSSSGRSARRRRSTGRRRSSTRPSPIRSSSSPTSSTSSTHGDFEGLTAILSGIVKANKQVLFEGNGYSEAWHAEAERRGLPNNKTTVDALPALDDQDAKELFSSFGVLSERELAVPRRDQLGALRQGRRHRGELRARHRHDDDPAGGGALPRRAQRRRRRRRGINAICQKVSGPGRLAASTPSTRSSTPSTRPTRPAPSRPRRRPSRPRSSRPRPTLREVVDELETLVADDLWPLPKYRELLFQY